LSPTAANIKNIDTELQNLHVQYKTKSKATLVAVTKGVDVAKIEEAILAGINNFGENYLQEALTKWIFLKEKYPHIKLHFIGGLQSNKLKKILKIFDVIQSIDSIALIDKIAQFNCYNTKFFIEVKASNTSNNRKGADILFAKELIKYAKSKNLNLTGIMAIAPIVSLENTKEENTKNVEEFFKELCCLKEEFNLENLSIGMSGDYKEAIKCGSTMVRIGSKIFGKRVNLR